MATPTSGPLNELVCIERDSFCLSGESGQVVEGGDQGLFIRDTRVLSRLELQIDGRPPAPLAGTIVGSGAARFRAASHGSDRSDDPTLLVDRRRVVADSMVEDIRLTNYGQRDCRVIVEVFAATDFAYIFDVKHGRAMAPARTSDSEGGLRFDDRQAERHAVLRPTPPADVLDPASGRLLWSVSLPARGSWDLTLSIGFTESRRTTWPTRTWAAVTERPEPPAAPPWAPPQVRCSSAALGRLVERSMSDLASLLVSDPQDASDTFLAAGSPWYLTLFGRDALWAARMLLPISIDVARHTLRALARRQGQLHDAETEEAPGKILHEVRHGGLVERSDLPATYYGSIDATLLWIVTLSDAWRWGLADEHVEPMLPACERALAWMHDHGDADNDGFVEYIGTGRGLANQGWKDSYDAISFANGELAQGPLALCEVQGYAHDAAVRGAELLDHFGRPGADRWRAWAAALRQRFRAAFWVDDEACPYPAVALDGTKRKVDAVASNMGHLPGTGLVNAEEIARIADRLTRPDMTSGWGLRTLSAASPRFNPLSYHGGSVWPHDTAIAAANLALNGHGAAAIPLVTGLVDAAAAFRYRLPELFGGDQRGAAMPPLPYPAACSPQAWSAAASVLALRALLGLDVHVPKGRVSLRPVWPPPYDALEVGGLLVGGQRLSLALSAADGVDVIERPDGLTVEIDGAAADARQHPAPAPDES